MITIKSNKNLNYESVYDDVLKHGRRVGKLAIAVANELGITDASQLENLGVASIMHDVGKVFIPRHIIDKPGKLTVDEFEIMKSHVKHSFRYMYERDHLKESALYVLMHHEYMNSSGYLKLKGENIPLLSRIITICDVFDALVSDRPYRQAFYYKDAINIITNDKSKYDVNVLNAFLNIAFKMHESIYIKDKINKLGV